MVKAFEFYLNEGKVKRCCMNKVYVETLLKDSSVLDELFDSLLSKESFVLQKVDFLEVKGHIQKARHNLSFITYAIKGDVYYAKIWTKFCLI